MCSALLGIIIINEDTEEEEEVGWERAIIVIDRFITFPGVLISRLTRPKTSPIPSGGSVSYTHLDVYKRQQLQYSKYVS